jgi:hypothetical protein
MLHSNIRYYYFEFIKKDTYKEYPHLLGFSLEDIVLSKTNVFRRRRLVLSKR